MKEARSIMGMPVVLEIVESSADTGAFEHVFNYLREVDERFSTYKKTSEIARINRGEIAERDYSPQMREVFALAKKTKEESQGYFNIKKPDGSLDPSGIVKGWAIYNAARMLEAMGYKNFFIDIAGDIASLGVSSSGTPWSVGVRSPFNTEEIIKIIYPHGRGVATSGSYIRGQHIYNPHSYTTPLLDVVSVTVVGPDVLEADRFATAAFSMGPEGIHFIESLDGYEGYSIDTKGTATMTSRFEEYTKPHALS